MNRIVAVSLLTLAPALAQADSVFLKGGGEIKGQIVEQRAGAVVVEVGPGRITVPMSTVVRIVSNESDLTRYHSRAAVLDPRDVAGWLDLALWAASRDLATQARDAYERVLAVDPQNSAAHLGLGDVRVGTRWMSLADANRARGLVEFEGIWVTPEERQARMAERAVLAEERQAMREAEARAREAEARVREAEARARAAEADARQAEQPVQAGMPYPYGYGAGPYLPGPFAPGGYGPIAPPVFVPAEPPPPPPPPRVRRQRPTTAGWVTEPARRSDGHNQSNNGRDHKNP
jgi:hypothetical protein